MKNTVCKVSFMNRPWVPVPNAATRRQVLDRILETLMVVATGAALGALLLLAVSIA